MADILLLFTTCNETFDINSLSLATGAARSRFVLFHAENDTISHQPTSKLK